MKKATKDFLDTCEEGFLYIKDGKRCVIPLHLNLCFHPEINADGIDFVHKRQTASFVYTHFRSLLADRIAKFIIRSEFEYFVIDMKRITDYTHHEVFNNFSNCLKNVDKQIFFININNSNWFKERMCQDFERSNLGLGEIRETENGIVLLLKTAKVNSQMIIGINELYHIIAILIVERQCLLPEKSFLESSNVFLNKYIHIKSLYSNADATMFISYHLCCMLDEYEMVRIVEHKKMYGDLDDYKPESLISSSSTGNVLATIIASLMNREVLYCSNIGPRFGIKTKYLSAKIMDSKNKDNGYIYIFDFICLGTELKTLGSMLKMNGSRISKCFGITSYLDTKRIKAIRIEELEKKKDKINKNDFNIEKERINKNDLEKICCLFSLAEAKYDYKVSINTFRGE